MSIYTERRQVLALAAAAVGASVIAGCAQRPQEPKPEEDAATEASAGRPTATEPPIPTAVAPPLAQA
ncbi:MAG TPA: twin-arginine translocation signal domain-containing protein, partial [Anaerolineales bacterium]|nr:twin-arginine translocation signal domain-containing protein [Anaerolineales bacterium]